MQKNLNIILIGIDTLRADRLGIYGYNRSTSPAIDEFGKDGVLFRNSFSQAATTAPSFMSIMTSRYPTYHGISANMGATGGGKRTYVLDERIPTLAQVLKKEGYRTGAFTDGGNVYSNIGFGRGFDYYSMNMERYNKPTGSIQADEILYWLQECSKEKFFLFFHSYAVHNPWLAPKEYREFFNRGYRGRFYVEQNFSEKLGVPKGANTYSYFLEQVRQGTEEEIQYLHDLYDGALKYVDDFIDTLMMHLEKLGLLKNTVIIFTSDHGEEFLEHGMLSHKQLYNELLHVPLMIRAPQFTTSVIAEQIVRSIDIFPTLFELLDIKINFPIQGTSLLEAPTKDLALLAVAETEGRGYTIQNKKYKYIFPQYKPYKTRTDELYDIENDPGEKHNIALDNMDIVEEMLAAFDQELHGLKLSRPRRRVMYLSSSIVT
jgi:arylsulfatase